MAGECRSGGEPGDSGNDSVGSGASAVAAGEPGFQRAEERRDEPGACLQREGALRDVLPDDADSTHPDAVAGEGEPAAELGQAGGQAVDNGPAGGPEEYRHG